MERLKELDYKGVFKYFSEISKIPRCSGNEKEISDYLVSFAKEHRLEYTQDDAYNVIMVKEASPGFENEPAIILQGHMDMVCEKEKDGSHDFSKDPIKLMVDGDFIHADGTTLGADNGIAVAYILALFSDDSLEHPRLEAIITTDEEVGMKGAKALDLSSLQGEYMINLDSEEEGYLLASCAGGLSGIASLPIKRVEEKGRKLKISIGGLKGGHSGVDIIQNRTNATKLMGRLLFDLSKTYSFGLIDMYGGSKDNVIPREAIAHILITDDNIEEIKNEIAELMGIYKKELASSEPELEYLLEDLGDGDYNQIHMISFEKILFLLVNMPNGVQVMSSDIEELVESSLNLGGFRIEEDRAIYQYSVRSSKGSYKHFISDRLDYMVSFLGGDYEVRAEYPAWEFKKDSPLRDHMQSIYQEIYGEKMIVQAIHAGLECGLIYEKMPGIDIVSIGPDMSRVHTVDEKVSISSTIRVYQFLEKVLGKKIK